MEGSASIRPLEVVRKDALQGEKSLKRSCLDREEGVESGGHQVGQDTQTKYFSKSLTWTAGMRVR